MRPVSSKSVSSFITSMTKAAAMAPIVALEGTVVLGRTYQAYKRGKADEARERFIEESMGSIVWLCGVGAMNKLGDKIVAKILKEPGANFDVGTDKVLRTPFENFMNKVASKGFSAKQVALIKGAKVLTSIVITNLFIGFVVPKVNQALTRKLRNDRKQPPEAKGPNPSFKGGAINAINAFTNAIENTNTGKLLSSDIGIAGGRMYNARRKEERREVAIRDIGSIYFYMWAQGHVIKLLNLIESGKASRLNPATVETLHKHLVDYIKDKNMNVEEFKKAILGLNSSDIKYNKDYDAVFKSEKPSFFDKLFKRKPLEVAKVADIENLGGDAEFLKRVREMSKLQPERLEKAVVTKQQFIDALNKAEINDPDLLNKVFYDFTDGAHKEEFRYVSNSKLYKLKKEMEQYVETICKSAKDGKVNKELLEKVQKRNLMYSGINFAAGFAVAAAFLSTFIPKIQYYITKKTTGVDAFPGTYDFEHHKEA